MSVNTSTILGGCCQLLTTFYCEIVAFPYFPTGAILDSTLLPPPGHRLPFYSGGRVLQILQARCAIRGWIRAALPLGGTDDIGYSYIHTLFEEFLMSLYEKAHGAFGEGGYLKITSHAL